MATSQNLQSFSGLDSVQQELPIAVMYQGRMQTAQGLHQEFTAGRKTGPGMIEVSYYLDSLDRVAVSGGGALGAADIQQTGQAGANGILADSTTGNFRFLSAGYKTQGVNVTLTEPLTPSMWVAVEYATGAGLAAKDGPVMELPTIGSAACTAGRPDRDNRPAGKGAPYRNESSGVVSVATGAVGDGGRSVCSVWRPSLFQLLSAAGAETGEPAAGWTRRYYRCHQFAGPGVSSVPLGGW